MEITCKRCQTEYDFDDALVSERGTTVRCTNCGEQFKVYRPTEAATQERWLVQRRDGRELLFTNMGDLQRAIANMQVGRHDVLVRGMSEPRPLGGIPELEPFFAGRLTQSTPPPGGATVPTATQPYEPILPRTSRTSRPPGVNVDGAVTATFPGPPSPSPAHAAEPAGLAPSALDAHADRLLTPAHANTQLSPRPPAVGAGDTGRSLVEDARLVNENEVERVRAGDPSYHPEDAARISYGPEQDWFGESSVSNPGRRRSRWLRGLVVLLILGLIGVAGATVGRKYIAAIIQPPVQVAPQGNARADALLEDGERALAQGDVETAKESFDKASALAERDRRVVLALARIEALRADQAWLKLRLLRPDQADAVAAAKQQLDLAVQRANRATSRLAEVAPDDPRTARARIDAARLAGDLSAARALALKVAPIATDPETVYVMAALDVAEAAPNWPAIVDRLKIAAAGEPAPSRARSALVYALVRSGDPRLAKSELEKLASAPHPTPVLPELKAFVSQPTADVDSARRDVLARSTVTNPNNNNPASPSGAASANATGNASTTARAPGNAAPAGRVESASPPSSGDFRTLLQQAAKASASRQYDRAEQLYRLALVKNPGDNEALGGLGDVARARGNTALARSYYEQVLAHNSHYLPALSGLADIQWDAGERASAAALYRQLVEASPDSSLARRARERISTAEGAAAPKPARPAASAAAPSEVPPGVDTTDLPELPR